MIVFGPVLSYPLVWDDQSLIANNPYLNDASYLTRSWTADFWRYTATPHESGMYRPLVTTTYFAERLLGGDASWVPHLTNLLVHLFNATLLAFLALRLGLSARTAALATALFALHPAVVEPVANVAGRTDAMAGMWLLLAIHARLQRQCPIRLSLSGLCVLAALLSKEQALVALPLLLIADARFESPPVKSLKWWIGRAIAPTAALVIYFALRHWALGSFFPNTQPLNPDATQWHLLDGPFRTLLYAFHALVPVSVNPYHHVAGTDLLSGLAAVAGLLLLAYYLVRFDRPNARFGAAWFIVALAPMAHWVPLQVRFSDLFLYVPLMGATLALGHSINNRPRFSSAAAGLALLFAIGSTLYVQVWRSERTLFEHAVMQCPASPPANLGLANALHRDGEDWRAFGHFEAAIMLGAEQGDNLTAAKASFAMGNIVMPPGHLDAAERHFKRALKLSNGAFYQADLGMARLKLKQQKLEEAQQHAKIAIKKAPDCPDAANTMGVVAGYRGDTEAAKQWFSAALKLLPGHPQARSNLKLMKQSR